MNAILLTLSLLLAPSAPVARASEPAARNAREVESGSPSELFTLVETAVRGADVGSLAKSFGRQVYVNLKGGESGYFSSNQASFILQSFFTPRRPVSFSFSTIQLEGEPFATGSGTFLVKGTRETLQLYVSVSRQGDRWVISQFNVY
jgi:HAMP domain-containing protein